MDQRYKQRSAKFSSSQDARVVRALANRVDRKAQRERRTLGRRNLDISDVLEGSSFSFHSVPETIPEPKKTYEEMQDELYQQLVVYKTDKKSKIEKEKQSRRPVFHTGGFTPDKPKFLVGIDSENFAPNKSESSKITPFKFMRSTTRSGGSSATKVLKFRSGATPNMASKENRDTAPCKSPEVAKRRILTESGLLNLPAGHSPKEMLKKLGSIKPSWKQMSNKSRAQSRMNAITKEQIRLETAEEELGVAALPSSPADPFAVSNAAVNTSKSLASKNRKSFAPEDFKFGFKGLVAHIKAKAMGIMEETENKSEKYIPIKAMKNKVYESVLEKNEEDNCAGEACSIHETKVNHIDNFVISSDGYNVVKENEITSESIPVELTSKITESKSDIDDQNSNFKDYMKHEEADENDDYTKEVIETSSVGEIDCTKHENKVIVTEKNASVFMPHEVTNVCEDSAEMMDVDENSENVSTPSQNNKVLSTQKSRRSSVSSCKGTLSCTPRHHSTHVKSCCDTGSPMSRLRPRTPCSRSTRRSIAAHSDHAQNLSFTSGRRSSTRRRSNRRSLAVSLKNEERASASPIKFYSSPALREAKGPPAEDKSCQDNTSKIKFSTTTKEPDAQHQGALNSSTFKQSTSQSKDTPTNIDNKTDDATQFATPSVDITGSVSRRKRGGRVSWMVECSPFITTSRGSSAKERRSISRMNADLTGLFDDIPTDGSPLPEYLMKGTPDSTNVNTTGDSSALPDRENVGCPAVEPISDGICTNLLSLLQPTSPEKFQSPDVSVWGEDTPTDTPLSQENPENMNQPSINQKQEEVINRLDTLQKPGCRKTRHSVMFSEDSTNTEKSGIRFPGTPIRNSTRVSMGLFSAADVNTTDPNISPSQNLLVFDSPKSERKSRGTPHSSLRMSLLPVVETPFTGQQTGGHRCSQTTEDLISWDSPKTNKRKSKGAALATPRRSRRMSKPIVE